MHPAHKKAAIQAPQGSVEVALPEHFLLQLPVPELQPVRLHLPLAPALKLLLLRQPGPVHWLKRQLLLGLQHLHRVHPL